MKILLGAAAALSLAVGGAQGALAKNGNGAEVLRAGLHAMASPPGQQKRADDPDQGDEHASLQAILTVCTKDTPAAERSAICDGFPVSPQ